MATLTTTASTYDAFNRYLGVKTARKIGNNTYAERLDAGQGIGIRLHSTVIVTYRPNDEMVLDSGGWRTVTTKDRMNQLLPTGLRLSSVQGVWSLSSRRDGELSEFYDGMVIDAMNGTMVSEPLKDSGREMKRVKREIGAYIRLYTDEEVARLVEDARENGTAGDCWFCSMVTTDGETLGAVTGDRGHLSEHIREGYTMDSFGTAPPSPGGAVLFVMPSAPKLSHTPRTLRLHRDEKGRT